MTLLKKAKTDMGFVDGIVYNLKGLSLGIRTPRLFFLGIFRFLVLVVMVLLFSGLILSYHSEILALVWTEPSSGWLVWVWGAVSWLLAAILAGISSLVAYLLAQILFCVFIMDWMSRITERIVTGNDASDNGTSVIGLILHLVRQEVPRAVVPILAMVFVSLIGFLTPFGPAVAVAASVAAATFLAWDNTDLVPARRMVPFKERFDYFKKNIGFHIGFGIWFLVPVLNILFLSFAPVGATLYYFDQEHS